VHGVYASGGHGHLFDGIRFERNDNGAGISIRRGNITIRNCRFLGSAISNNNEDEGSVSVYTGSPSRDLTFWFYRNVVTGGYLYQGTENDDGVLDPGHTWLVFNNTFVGSDVNFGSPGGHAEYYDIYLRNNVFSGGSVTMKAPYDTEVHALSNNGWWGAGTVLGSENVLTDPQLDGEYEVGAEDYRDAGTSAIGPGAVMPAGAAEPMGYVGVAPDIGHSER
jgi:hypothetical protein